MEKYRQLSQLTPGTSATVCDIRCADSLRRRLLDMGLVRGTVVYCVGQSPLGDPLVFLVRGRMIAIRRSDAIGVLTDA